MDVTVPLSYLHDLISKTKGLTICYDPTNNLMDTLPIPWNENSKDNASMNDLVCALVKKKSIDEVVQHACAILHGGQIHTDIMFSVLGETFGLLKKIRRVLKLPCDVACLQKSFKACGLTPFMSKELAGILQSYYIYMMPSEAHVFRLSCLLEYSYAPVLIAREMQVQRKRSFHQRNYQKTAEWCLAGNIKLSRDKSSALDLADELPLFTFILLVQMVLPQNDSDIAYLYDIVTKKPGAKQILYTILDKLLPLQVLLHEIKTMFFKFTEVVITFMAIPDTAHLTEWIKHTIYFHHLFPENSFELYQTIHICVHARWFICNNSDSATFPYNDILSCVGWFLHINLNSGNLEMINPYALTPLHLKPLKTDESGELQRKVSLYLNGHHIREAEELKVFFCKIGLDFSLLVDWYLTANSSFPAKLLENIFMQCIEVVDPNEFKQNIAAVVASPRPTADADLCASVLKELHDDVSLLLTFGPMLAFLNAKDDAWSYYVPGLSMAEFVTSSRGLYPALFFGFFLVYVGVRPGYFNIYFLSEEFYKGEFELSAQNVLMIYDEYDMPDEVNVAFNELTQCTKLLERGLHIYLSVFEIEAATKLDVIQAFQNMIGQYKYYIDTNVVQHLDTHLSSHEMDFFFSELKRMATNEVFNLTVDKLHALYEHTSKSHQLMASMAHFINKCRFISTDDQYQEIVQLLEAANNHPAP